MGSGLTGLPMGSNADGNTVVKCVTSERSLSLAGRTLEERRTLVSSDSVDGLLFLYGL